MTKDEKDELKSMKSSIREENKIDQVQAAKDELTYKRKEAELRGETLSESEEERLKRKIDQKIKERGEAEYFDKEHSDPTYSELEENKLEAEEVRQQ